MIFQKIAARWANIRYLVQNLNNFAVHVKKADCQELKTIAYSHTY